MGYNHFTMKMKIHRIPNFLAFSYLIETDAGIFLVDAGYYGGGDLILLLLKNLGYKPEDIRLLFLTHGHVDHFGGAVKLREVLPELPILIHPNHLQTIVDGTILVSPGQRPESVFYEKLVLHATSGNDYSGVSNPIPVNDGERLDGYGLPGRVIHMSGHSEGDMVLLLDSGEVFVGDLTEKKIPLLQFKPSSPSMAVDLDAALVSCKRISELPAHTIYPAHGSVFGMEEFQLEVANWNIG